MKEKSDWDYCFLVIDGPQRDVYDLLWVLTDLDDPCNPIRARPWISKPKEIFCCVTKMASYSWCDNSWCDNLVRLLKGKRRKLRDSCNVAREKCKIVQFV